MVCGESPQTNKSQIEFLIRAGLTIFRSTNMSSILRWSLLAISFAAGGYSNPLSTSPYNVPRQRSPLTLAPLMAAQHPHGSINNSYIVMLKDDVPATVMQNHFNFLSLAHESDPLELDDGVESGIRHVYQGHITGYSGMFTDRVVERIREMPEVDYIERDQIVRTTSVDTQRSAPWASLYLPYCMLMPC
jgi:cerevisin